jgi:3-phenylpropionate/trans-cinnamate dioxygenase ferredoxin subunit
MAFALRALGKEVVVVNKDRAPGALQAFPGVTDIQIAEHVEGEFDAATCTVECPRHGSLFDLTSGRPKTLPAYAPVETFPVAITGETITLEVD